MLITFECLVQIFDLAFENVNMHVCRGDLPRVECCLQCSSSDSFEHHGLDQVSGEFPPSSSHLVHHVCVSPDIVLADRCPERA